jgi:hypothetical protein
MSTSTGAGNSLGGDDSKRRGRKRGKHNFEPGYVSAFPLYSPAQIGIIGRQWGRLYLLYLHTRFIDQ